MAKVSSPGLHKISTQENRLGLSNPFSYSCLLWVYPFHLSPITHLIGFHSFIHSSIHLSKVTGADLTWVREETVHLPGREETIHLPGREETVHLPRRKKTVNFSGSTDTAHPGRKR